MTIARKLWLGFGVLIGIFVLACLVNFFIERSVNRSLDETIRVEGPTRAASYEMEINATEMAKDVQDYLLTGDARYRERFEGNRADFERFKDRYDALVDTEKGEEHGDRIEALYEEYTALGGPLRAAGLRAPRTGPPAPIGDASWSSRPSWTGSSTKRCNRGPSSSSRILREPRRRQFAAYT